jgi:Glycosyl hydrolases family 16/IPT/TIG domain
MRMVFFVLATLLLVTSMLHASAPSAPAGATLFDNFSSGSLDTSKWIPSNWGAPGGGTFVPSNLDFSSGMLRITVTQAYNSSGDIASVGGELQSKQLLGFGTYEWVIRASSTSSTPTGSGVAVSGQISSGFVFVNNSQSEIDSPEIEGQNPGTLWWTTWTSATTKQYTSTQAAFAPEAGFHSYKCLWTSTSINFYVDGVLVSTHTGVVPQTPAYAMINHWGTNSTGWGGLASPNVTRYMFVRSFSFIPLSASTNPPPPPPPPPPTNPAPTVSGISPTSGTTAGGSPVTISGTGFLAGATVAFGTTAATSVTVVSGTSITAMTPSHAAGAANVVVTNTDGQSGTLTNGYTYTSPSGGSGGGIALVQSGSGPTTLQATNTTLSVSYPIAQTAGDLNVVVVGWGDVTSTVSTVTDSHSNGYVQAGGTVTGSGLRQAIFYAKNIAGGSNTVTVTFNKAAAYPDLRILEYSGLDTSNPLDVTAAGSGTGTTATSASATTTSANELIVGAGNNGNGFSTAGTGFTLRMIDYYGNLGEDKTVSSTGSYSVTAPLKQSTVWVMQMATFRASGQGSSKPAPTLSGISPTSGTTAGGTPVTITGTGFLAGATVAFGTTAASGVTVVSATSITATTPAHAAGAVNVVVTNTDAQSGTLTNGYTYTSSSGGGGIAFMQSGSGPNTLQATDTTLSVSYPVAQTVGDLNVVVVGWGDVTSTVSTVTDSHSNVYTQAGGTVTGTGLRQAIFFAKNIAAGTNTVTVTFNQAAAYPDMRIMEYSGLDTSNPLDVTAAAVGTGTTATSAAVTTTSANELIVGAGNNGDGFSGAGTGFTLRMIDYYGNLAEDETVSSTGSYSVSAPLKKSTVWVMQMATFKASP